jgi:hypothetical protein
LCIFAVFIYCCTLCLVFFLYVNCGFFSLSPLHIIDENITSFLMMLFIANNNPLANNKFDLIVDYETRKRNSTICSVLRSNLLHQRYRKIHHRKCLITFNIIFPGKSYLMPSIVASIFKGEVYLFNLQTIFYCLIWLKT